MPPTTKQAEKATVVNFFEWVKERINTFAPLPACLTDCLVPEQVSREQECVRDYEALQRKHRSNFGQTTRPLQARCLREVLVVDARAATGWFCVLQTVFVAESGRFIESSGV